MRIAVFGKGVELVLGGAACELGGDLFGGSVAGGVRNCGQHFMPVTCSSDQHA